MKFQKIVTKNHIFHEIFLENVIFANPDWNNQSKFHVTAMNFRLNFLASSL